MKTLLLNASLAAFLCSFSIGEEIPPLKKYNALSESLENAKFEQKDSSISLDFVLKNPTQKAILIAERWNSWGAYQWTVNVSTADHQVIEFKNPQMEWGKNFLSAVSIEPGKELRLHCKLIPKQLNAPHEAGIEMFMPKAKDLAYTFPVHLVGTFAASLQDNGRVKTNWEGTIKTPEVELKK